MTNESNQLLSNLLIISHVRDNSVANGGAVYTKGFVEALRSKYKNVEIIYIYEKKVAWKEVRIAMSFIRAFFSKLPAKIIYFYSFEALKRIKGELKRVNPDLIIFDHLEAAVYIDLIDEGKKIVLIQHNDEVSLYSSRIARLKYSFLKQILAGEVKKLAKFQSKSFEKIRNVIFLSEDEAAHAPNNLIRSKFTLLPSFSYAPAKIGSSSQSGKDIVFLGNMDWWPNADAVNWFLREILSKLTHEITVHLVGHGSHRWDKTHPFIKTHGFVEDRDKAWGLAPIFIAPIRSGAGVNIKVAEAIYNGRSLIATPQALRGMSLESDDAIVILDGEKDWIDFFNSFNRLEILSRTVPKEINRSLFKKSVSEKSLSAYVEEILMAPSSAGR